MSPKPQEIKIEEYNYDLPESKIPKYPLEYRDQSKLLVYKEGGISTHLFNDIKNILPTHSTLIFNDSKVLPVRFHFETSSGGTIEVFCLEPIEETSGSINTSTWKCLVGKARLWKDKTLSNKKGNCEVRVELISKTKNYCIVQFEWNAHLHSMLAVFETFGQIPIPPYLNRNSEAIDTIRYQNVFADKDGSVAAPTAGLHFTTDLIHELKVKGTDIDFVTLHVGAGTFKPVTTLSIGEHDMHMERMLITLQLIENLLDKIEAGKNITAVGTTSLRTLESIYWLGNKLITHPQLSITDLIVTQWEPYNGHESVSTAQSLWAIKNWMEKNDKQVLVFGTEILIVPSYQFRIVDCLITNFHQPKSTLLLLIAAAIGNDWRAVYNFALNNEYRFLSYGDGSLLHFPLQHKLR